MILDHHLPQFSHQRDFCLLPKLKLTIKEMCLDTISDIQKASTAILEAAPKIGFRSSTAYFKKFTTASTILLTNEKYILTKKL